MSTDLQTIAPLDSVAKAARIMRSRKIGALPAVAKGRVVGIITESDVLDALVALLSCSEPSTLITIDIGEDEDWLAHLARFAKRERVSLLSLSYLEHGDTDVAIARVAGTGCQGFVDRVWKAGLFVLSVQEEEGALPKSKAAQ